MKRIIYIYIHREIVEVNWKTFFEKKKRSCSFVFQNRNRYILSSKYKTLLKILKYLVYGEKKMNITFLAFHTINFEMSLTVDPSVMAFINVVY